MNWMDTWLFPLGSVLLGGVGLLVLWRGLLGRRFLVRKTRACRRCRYDMTQTEGPKCPECGYAARHEGEHYAGRRRWQVVGLGLVLLFGAVGSAMAPGVRSNGWLRLLPLELQVRLFHLEANDDTYGEFYHQIERSRYAIRYGRASPFTNPAAPRRDQIGADRLEPLLGTLHRVAIANLSKPAPDRRTVSRSLSMISNQTRDKLTAQELDQLIQRLGVTTPGVRAILSVWQGELTHEIAEARRAAFYAEAPRQRAVLGSIVAHRPAGPADYELIGDWLADPEPNGDPSYEHARSRLPNVPEEAVDWALVVYAEHIRSRGACGNYKTLSDAIKVSPVVAGAMVDWIGSLESEDDIDRWRQIAWPASFEYHAEQIEADWIGLRARCAAGTRLSHQATILQLIKRFDAGATDWLIGLIRGDDEDLRKSAMYELAGVKHNRTEAASFALGEAWNDDRISLWYKTWPLVRMESWYGAEIPALTDLGVCWTEILERASHGDNAAFEEGLPRFVRSHEGQSVFALLAVAERLMEDRTLEPWLETLAADIADSCTQEASIQGFVETLRNSEGIWTWNQTAFRDQEPRAAELATQIESKFGPWDADSGSGSP